MHLLERSQFVPADLETVFRFFEDPLNLETITPPWMNFEVKSSTDDVVQKGTEIGYRLRWLVFPMAWKSRISEYESGVLFADEMIRGPYKRWYHRHLFRSVQGGVQVRDVVEYELPCGPLGQLVHRCVVRSQLEAIFDYRRDTIERMFGVAGQNLIDKCDDRLRSAT